MRSVSSRILAATAGLAVGALVLAGCQDDPQAPGTTVVFVLDAPLCSSSLPVEFLIDGTVAGSDTFRIHLPPDDTISPVFRTSAGAHVLGARVIGGFVWPDTTVTLAPGASITRTLPFYCS